MHLRVLGRILLAQSLSSLGTSISTIALSYMVLKLTGSVLQMGGVMAISTFPLVVTSFIGGALLDRFSARNLMVLADLCRAALIFCLPFLVEHSLVYVYVISGLMGLFSAMFNPGQVKVIGDLAEKEHLVRANSYLSVSRDGAELLGYLLGAPLVIALGYTLTFSLDAVSYLVSALCLAGLPTTRPAGQTAPRLGSLLAEAPAVVGQIWRKPALRTNLLLATFAAMAVMMSLPNSYGLAFDVFDRGAWGLTALEVFSASGMIAGGVILSCLSLPRDKNTYVVLGLLAMAVCFVAVSVSSFFWLSVSFLGLAGLANVAVFVPSITLFQETAEEGHKGRLIAIRAGFGQMGTTAGLLLGGALGSYVGIKPAFLIAGILGIVLTLAIYLPYWWRGWASPAARLEGGGRLRRQPRPQEPLPQQVSLPLPAEGPWQCSHSEGRCSDVGQSQADPPSEV